MGHKIRTEKLDFHLFQSKFNLSNFSQTFKQDVEKAANWDKAKQIFIRRSKNWKKERKNSRLKRWGQ